MFVDELTTGGYGLIDRIARQMYQAQTGRPLVGVGDLDELARVNAARPVVPFVDLDPERPLQLALYSREYAYSLFEGTGWMPLELRPPNEFAHHHFVCVPSSD